VNKEEIKKVLNEWNLWNRDLPDTLKRAGYENEIEKKCQTDGRS